MLTFGSNAGNWYEPNFSSTGEHIDMGFKTIISSVPEPETYTLMLIGLGLIGFVARFKKAKQKNWGRVTLNA